MNPRNNAVECTELPEIPSTDVVYRLLPKEPDAAYYRERTDRNIGWIEREEQEMLRSVVVGIAGCGGMGGLLASIFLRLGIGEVRIADCETFDVSNINRQYAAKRGSIGLSKAFETARMVRDVTDDGTLVVFPQGIVPETVDTFLAGCDIVCDEIEFWAIGSRLLLHERARILGVPLLNCSTVGFGTRLFFFDHDGLDMAGMLGFSLPEAFDLQARIQSRTATIEDVQRVMGAMITALIPEVPEYGALHGSYRSAEIAARRLREECRAPIIATNPPMASGFVADHTLLILLRKSAIRRNVVQYPKTPGYLYLDAGLMQARIVQRAEV